MSVVAVGDIAEQVRGIAYSKADATTQDGIGLVPILRANNISEVGLVFTDLVYVPEKYVRPHQYIKQGDVVIAASSGSLEVIGKAAELRRDFHGSFGAFCKVLRPNQNKIDPIYFSHFFKTAAYRRKISSMAAGANINNLKNEHLDALLIPLPPLNEQKRLAAILDQADRLRQKRRQAIALLDSLGSALIDEITTQASRRAIALGDCLSFVTSGGRNWSRYYAETGDRFIRSLDVQMNFLGNDEVVYVQAPDNAEARRTRTQSGDVLLTITGSRIGRVAALTDAEAGSYVSQHVAILRPITSKVSPEFLSFFLSSSAGQRQIAKWQYGQTKPGLNFEQIRSFELPDIDRDIQTRFVAKVHAIARKLAEGYNQDLILNALFSSLQHRAFAGQL